MYICINENKTKMKSAAQVNRGKVPTKGKTFCLLLNIADEKQTSTVNRQVTYVEKQTEKQTKDVEL